jgi:hypothetical protein
MKELRQLIQDYPEKAEEIFTMDSPVGLSLAELVKWAKKLEDRYGPHSVIDSLDADPEYPHISFSNKS